MQTIYVNDFEELQNYQWNYNEEHYRLTIEEDEYITIEVIKNEELEDMIVLSDFNFENLTSDLEFINKYGLRVDINEKYIKLKYRVKYVVSEIIKRKDECSENKNKDWVYGRHELYEFKVKEECLSNVESLLSILDIE